MPLAPNTFDNLVIDITRYAQVNSTSFGDEIPRFIANAQQTIGLQLKTVTNRIVKATTLQADIAALDKPTNYRHMSSFEIFVGNTRKALRPATYGYCSLLSPNGAVPGEPFAYCELDQYNLLVAPTPDESYPCLLIYYLSPQGIYEGSQQNNLTLNAYNLLMYRSLVEAGPYLRTDQTAVFQGLYDQTLANFIAEEQMRTTSGFYERALQ